jgi:hypothetical protein
MKYRFIYFLSKIQPIHNQFNVKYNHGNREKCRLSFLHTVLSSSNETEVELSINLRLYSPLFDLGRFFLVPLTGDQPVGRPIPAHRTAQTKNKRTQTSMPQVGFEPTIRVFEQAKTVHILDSVATLIGEVNYDDGSDISCMSTDAQNVRGHGVLSDNVQWQALIQDTQKPHRHNSAC